MKLGFSQYLQSRILAVLAVIFAIVLNVYVLVHALFTKRADSGVKLAANNCSDPTGTELKVNPNKMFFISCGGFFE